MSMLEFARVCDAVAATTKRLEKVAVIAAYLRTLDDDGLDAAARFFSGRAVPPREPQPAIGSRTIGEAACEVFGRSADELRAAYRAHGDLSEAAAALFTPPFDLGFFQETLAPATLLAKLREAASTRGGKGGVRKAAVVAVLRACATARETAAVVKVLTGELRIGSREGLILDAVAAATDRPAADVRRALAAHPDIGLIACAARRDALHEIAPAYGVFIHPMLATPMAYGSAYAEIQTGDWIADDKYDGIRAQLHVAAREAFLFSRTGNEISASFPEILDAARSARVAPGIFDGEIVAFKDGRPSPFRVLQPRLQRKNPSARMREDIPVVFMLFDQIGDGDEMIVDLPLRARRERLAAHFKDAADDVFALAPFLDAVGGEPARIEELFFAARERGNEGLLFKRADGAYSPGKRGTSWIKLKRELSTIDAVVVGVEWGHGKRAKMLSDYTFAVRDAADGLVTIGKAYSGLTDEEIMRLTPWFLERRTGETGRRAFAVRPELIVEIAFDVIAPSALHAGGYSLRFPRIVRLREDRSAADCTTLREVDAIYQEMLARESGVREVPDAAEASPAADENAVPETTL